MYDELTTLVLRWIIIPLGSIIVLSILLLGILIGVALAQSVDVPEGY